MRTLLAGLALLLLLPGCTDSLGIGGGGCAVEMAATRAQRGPPDDTESGFRSELWIYNAEQLAITFSWGADGEGCEVSESRFVRVPLRPGRPTL